MPSNSMHSRSAYFKSSETPYACLWADSSMSSCKLPLAVPVLDSKESLCNKMAVAFKVSVSRRLMISAQSKRSRRFCANLDLSSSNHCCALARMIQRGTSSLVYTSVVSSVCQFLSTIAFGSGTSALPNCAGTTFSVNGSASMALSANASTTQSTGLPSASNSSASNGILQLSSSARFSVFHGNSRQAHSSCNQLRCNSKRSSTLRAFCSSRANNNHSEFSEPRRL